MTMDSAGSTVEAAIISPGETYLKLISSLNDVELSPMAPIGVKVGRIRLLYIHDSGDWNDIFCNGRFEIIMKIMTRQLMVFMRVLTGLEAEAGKTREITNRDHRSSGKH